jgi:hypothetical protein
MLSLVTVVCAYPVRLPDAVAATVITESPKPTGTSAENDPSLPAVAVATSEAAPVVVSSDSTTTLAPGTVLPVTVTEASRTAVSGVGPVSVTGALPGGAWFTYRSAVTAGCSSARPAPMSSISRSSCAWAQVSGDADPAALPSLKPIDATVGSVPNGDASRSGFSHACSGTRPTPEENWAIASSSRLAAGRARPATSDSARSPDSTGHRCPVPVFVVGQGWPWPRHDVWLGW